MNEGWIKLAIDCIWDKTRIPMQGVLDTRERRIGVSFWFINYTRSNGPVFSIHPFGLKRHSISMRFGPYAASCVEHIKSRASSDDYNLANAFIDQIGERVEINRYNLDNGFTPNLSINSSIVAVRRVDDQDDLPIWLESIDEVLVPLVAAMAELVGYDAPEDSDETNEIETLVSGTPEGRAYLELTQKRERNPKNRLLCLMIHGSRCGVCGIVPQAMYGDVVGSILEVHHIEPLSELQIPKLFDPKSDLVPLCPNCHRAIHKRKPAYTPEELKGLMQQ